MRDQKEVSGHLRPLNPRRDLEGVSKLIEIAFAEDFQRLGIQFQEELKTFRRFLPWVLLLGRISRFFRELMGGYVWEEQGQIVGSVMVHPRDFERRKWHIGMVATHPEYRGRGIARRLMEAAIEHIRARGGEMALLSVRADNVPAYQLYLSLGFVHFDTITHFRLDGVPKIEFKPVPGYEIRPMGLGEWRPRYELMKVVTPAEVQAFYPLSEREYRVTLWERVREPLLNFLHRTEDRRWAAEAGGKVVGVLSLEAVRYPSMHHLRLLVHPEHETVAEALLTKALSTLKTYPGRGVLAIVRSSYTGFLELFKRYGFVEGGTIHHMGLKLLSSPQKLREITS